MLKHFIHKKKGGSSVEGPPNQKPEQGINNSHPHYLCISIADKTLDKI